MLKVGVTGTRNGMDEKQRRELHEVMHANGSVELHHGDCIGVDVQVAEIATELGYKTVCHPPSDNKLRAFHKSDEFRNPQTYFARNRNIVDECDVLLVIPFETMHQEKGGTWYTHDYAVKKRKRIILILPEKDRPYPD